MKAYKKVDLPVCDTCGWIGMTDRPHKPSDTVILRCYNPNCAEKGQAYIFPPQFIQLMKVQENAIIDS